MAVRICTVGVPRFCHDGLVVDEAWRDFDFAKAAAPARKAFLEYFGQFVRVHPDDEAELAKLLEKVGAELYVDGPSGRRRIRALATKAAAKT